MNRRFLALAVAGLVAAGIAGPMAVHANQHGTTYELDLDTDGAGSSADGDETVQVEIDADGDANVQDNPDSPDRTASGQGLTVDVALSNGDSYTLDQITLGGQGSSFAATGVDGWALYLVGTDNGGVQFAGNFTLTGNDDGYAVQGEAILNVPDQSGDDATTYQFGVQGEATFAPSS